MMYKVPMPTNTNGVRLYTLKNKQIGIEYQTGEPQVGKMAYDSALGSMTRDVSFKPRARPDLDRIVAEAKRKVLGSDAAPNIGYGPHSPGVAFNREVLKDMNAGTMEYDDDASKVISNLMSYLGDKLTPEQLEDVTMILSSGDAPDNDTGESHNYQATDRRGREQAADQARRRPMSDAAEQTYMKMFPQANRLA